MIITLMEEVPDNEEQEFWKHLGGKTQIKTAEQGGNDADVSTLMGVKKMMRLSDASGQLTMTPVAEGKLLRDMLKPEDVFIVDAGFEVFVWVGAYATAAVRPL